MEGFKRYLGKRTNRIWWWTGRGDEETEKAKFLSWATGGKGVPSTDKWNRGEVHLLGGGGKSSFKNRQFNFGLFTLKCLLPISAPSSPVHCHYSREAHRLAPNLRKDPTWCPSSRLTTGQPTSCLVIFLKQRSHQVIFDFILKALTVPLRKC